MRLKDFHYYLPQNLIAQSPISDRQMSRLLLLNKDTGKLEHDIFKNIINYLNIGDCLVLNDTRVIPARLYGERGGTLGKIEFVLLKRKSRDEWEIMLKPGRRAKKGAKFIFGNGELTAEILEVIEDGNRIVRFYYDGIFEQILDKLGEMPLPPYIKEKLVDRERYQTVYSKNDGSAAAPTAGFHFTKELLKVISEKGVNIAFLTLHIGLGTFRMVKTENIKDHVMHSEYFEIDEKNAQIINNTKKSGGRIIPVGTTSCRTLETIATNSGIVRAQSGWTDIFIYPGYQFKITDAMITNFHLPESTLIMLISALAGRENVLNAYRAAVDEKYRFFSFGDAMYIN